jgi:hypothetical protein
VHEYYRLKDPYTQTYINHANPDQNEMMTEYTPCGKARHFNAAGADSMAAAAAGTAKFSEVVDATNLGCCWISFSEIVSSGAMSALLPMMSVALLPLPLASLSLSIVLSDPMIQ